MSIAPPFNLHTHTDYVDGKDAPEALVAAAKKLGFCALGFSEHAYNPLDLHCCLPKDSGVYYAHINRLKRENEGQMDIFLGLEIDAYETRDTSMLDYFIGSIHGVRADGGYFIVDGSKDVLSHFFHIAYDGDEQKAVKAYYDDYCAMAHALKPDILGHFDLITKLNGNGEFFDEESKAYRRAALLALDAALDTGAILEVNTGAMARGHKSAPYPARFLLERARERRARITVTSDCHDASKLDYAFSETAAMLRGLGFTEQAALTKNGFISVAL